MREKKNKFGALSAKRILYVCLAIMGAVLMTACSKDKNEENLRKVLEQMYNGPDKELVELSMEEPTINESEIKDGETGVASIKEWVFFDKLEELYQPLFTEEAYQSLLEERELYKYHLEAWDNKYTLKTDSININQSKTDKTKYEFTVQVKYTPETGDAKTIDIQGTSQFSEDGKINYLKVFSDLILKLNE